MTQSRFALLIGSTFALLAATLPASAIPLNDKVAIEARGFADLDGRLGPQPALSSQTEQELDEPFARSGVSVSAAQAGVYEYFASADIGNLALKVSGAMTNSGATEANGFGTPLIQAVAEARDVVTLTTTRTDSFDVTVNLVIDGSVTAGANSDASANSLLTFGVDGQLLTTDAALYQPGIISDTLTVTRTVSGPTVSLRLQTLLSFTATRIGAGESVSGELDNTAFIQLVLPADVQIASSLSGTFGVPIPIPEPGTWLLMALGLVPLVGFARSRSRKQH